MSHIRHLSRDPGVPKSPTAPEVQGNALKAAPSMSHIQPLINHFGGLANLRTRVTISHCKQSPLGEGGLSVGVGGGVCHTHPPKGKRKADQNTLSLLL